MLRSAALGAAIGLVLSAGFAAAVRYLGAFARLEQRLHGLLGPLGEREITVLALSSALGEEFFFRLAMQDALGVLFSAAGALAVSVVLFAVSCAMFLLAPFVALLSSRRANR